MPVPGVLDTGPSQAMAYDSLCGGTLALQKDREVAERVLAAFGPPPPGEPPVPCQMIASSREFLYRAVSHCVHEGRIRQFIDLGSGLPVPHNPQRRAAGPGSVHEVAQRVRADARVAYVDRDAAAALYGSTLLRGVPGTAMVQADLTDPEAVLGRPEVAGLIDRGQPLGLLATMVLHFSEAGYAAAVMRQWVALLAPGSYVVITCARLDDEELFWRVREAYSPAGDLRNHGTGEFAALFAGAEVQPPGLVPARGWHAGWGDYPGEHAKAYVLAGMARKT